MFNQVILTGRLSQEATIKETKNGHLASFTVATSQQGKGKEEVTEFVPCIAWDATAQALAKFTGKGSLVQVIGRVKTDKYEKGGQKRSITRVVANLIKFLDPKKQNRVTEPVIDDIDLPF